MDDKKQWPRIVLSGKLKFPANIATEVNVLNAIKQAMRDEGSKVSQDLNGIRFQSPWNGWLPSWFKLCGIRHGFVSVDDESVEYQITLGRQVELTLGLILTLAGIALIYGFPLVPNILFIWLGASIVSTLINLAVAKGNLEGILKRALKLVQITRNHKSPT